LDNLTVGTSLSQYDSDFPEPEVRRQFVVAYIGLLLFVTVYYARPNDWIPGVTFFPFARIAAAIGLLGLIGSFFSNLRATTARLFRFRPTQLLLLLYFWTWVTIPFASWRGGAFQVVMEVYSEVIAISVLVLLSVTDVGRLRKLLFVSIVPATIASVFAMRDFVYLMQGRIVSKYDDRIAGIFQNVFSNPNDLALNVVVLLPFCCAFAILSSGLKKLFWWTCAGLMIGGVIASFSRGGFLALVAGAGVVLLRTKGARRVFFVFLLIVAVAALLVISPGGFLDRISTILNPDKDLTGSANARLAILMMSLQLTAEHPIVGLGPGNFDSVTKTWHGTHNIYTEFSSEAGILALVVFLLLLRQAFRFAKRATRSTDRNIAVFGSAALVSLVILAVGTFFYSGAYQFFTYFPICYAFVVGRMAESTVPDVDEKEPSGLQELTADAVHDNPFI
jgi:O-antigen ligase